MFSSARPFAQKYRRDGALRYFFFGMFGGKKDNTYICEMKAMSCVLEH